MVGGDILSVYPLDGDWTRLQDEYWWRALAAAALPPRPTALLVGLGGGTQVHLLRRLARPRLITVIERDPAMVQVAGAWFGLDAVGPLEILCRDVAIVAPVLRRARRRFDYVMDDVSYAEAPARAAALALALAPLVAPGGTLVVNRHRSTGDAPQVAAALRGAFASVRLRRWRRGDANILIVCRDGCDPLTSASSAPRSASPPGSPR